MNINDLLKQKESENLEFKLSFDKEAIETVGAFSNTDGGTILIGVSDDGEIKGLHVGKDTVRKWLNEICQATEPAIIPEIRIIDSGGKKIGLIEIKEFPLKPVAVKGKSFKRIADSNKTLASKEIADLHLHSTGSSWDAITCLQAGIKDLNMEILQNYIDRANLSGRRRFAEKPLDVLKKIELIKKELPTWASLLLFSKNPQRFLGQARIHCGRFKTASTIIDDNYIEGGLISQVERALSSIQKNMSVRYEIEGLVRKEIWDYPILALREAILNSVCHRDYREISEITIKIFDDYISIWTPGGLPVGTTLKDLYDPDHPSNPRNRLIAQVFYDIGEIERYGSGIQRMIQSCLDAGLPPPEFKEVFGGFQVIFRKNIYSEKFLSGQDLNERQLHAVSYVKEYGEITNREYREITGTTRTTATRDLAGLVRKKIFVSRGKGKREVHYKLNDSIMIQ